MNTSAQQRKWESNSFVRLTTLVFVLSFASFSVAQITSVSRAGRFVLWKNEIEVVWNFARDHCKGDGGWLAADVSVESHNVLVTVPGAGGAAWLGGSDEAEDDVWRWVTGPVGREDKGRGRVFFKGTYTNNPTCILQHCFWNINEPNDWNSAIGEQFLMVLGGTVRWNDLASHGHNVSIGTRPASRSRLRRALAGEAGPN